MKTSHLLGEKKRGKVFIVSAPPGTGKTTLVQKLVREFPEVIASISYTTRLPRKGEIADIDYHFIQTEEFEAKIQAEDFLEYVKLYETYYGTCRQWVEAKQNAGQHVVLVIDTQGALQLKNKISAIFIFIQPPSIEILRQRLVQRQTETEEMIQKRMEWAQQELNRAKDYDYQFVNDDLETAYEILKGIVIAECHRVEKV